jgi:hypothetical protein
MMKRRIVSGVLWGLLAMASGCGKSTLKLTPGQACTGLTSTVADKDGVRYLFIQVPDNKVVVLKLDELPQGASSTGSAAPTNSAAGSASRSGSGGGSFVECPCQEQSCIPMCGVIHSLVGPGANLCPAPPPPAAH